MPAPLLSFDGVSDQDNVSVVGTMIYPPDTEGDVGPNHYVQWNNSVYKVFSKDGSVLLGPLAGNSLWSGFGGPCETTNWSDPIVRYDRLADRWFISQAAYSTDAAGDFLPPAFQCVAVSTSPDPTGSFFRYAYQTPNNHLSDYPKFGVWPDAYYGSYNLYDCPTTACASLVGAAAFAFDRSKMLMGDPSAGMLYFELSSNFGLLPSHLNGPIPPPVGAPNTYIQQDYTTYTPMVLHLYAFHVDFTTPTNATFTALPDVSVAPYDWNLCNQSADCIPQPGTSQRLDPVADRLMFPANYRRFPTYESLVFGQTVDVNGTNLAGVRWYELRKVGGSWSVYQQGTYAGDGASPDGIHRWMGSVNMDGSGNIAVGYSVADSSTVYPGVRYVGRLASDPLGTLPQGEMVLVAGGGAQVGSNRWGDYSAMSIDPVDDCTFWYTQEYYKASDNGTLRWSTRIGAFRFSQCTPLVGRDRLAIWRPSTGQWWLRDAVTGSGGVAATWGVSTDTPTPADYDGDGRTDLAVWRPSTGQWWVIPSTTGSGGALATWGVQSDSPLPGDYTGDGRTDFTVWRPATGEWWVRNGVTGAGGVAAVWGVNGDIPVPGDYLGDGRWAYAVWRPTTGQWWVRSALTGAVVTVTWGVSGDIPVPGDYDGDGRTDYAVWRPATGEWWVRSSRTGSGQVLAVWGQPGDIPVPGDYLGLGRLQVAVWRPTTGVWWILDPQTGQQLQVPWGQQGDTPLRGVHPSFP